MRCLNVNGVQCHARSLLNSLVRPESNEDSEKKESLKAQMEGLAEIIGDFSAASILFRKVLHTFGTCFLAAVRAELSAYCSAEMPAALMAAPHFAISRSTSACKYSGERRSGLASVAPSSCMRS